MCLCLSGCSTALMLLTLPRTRTHMCTTCAHDYLVVVSKEPAYEAVERNTSGSRPRELFEVRVFVLALSHALTPVVPLSLWPGGAERPAPSCRGGTACMQQRFAC